MRLTSIVTSSIDPSRTVTLASAALPDEEAGFFFGVLGLVAGAASAVLDSAGMALLLAVVDESERVPPSGRG